MANWIIQQYADLGEGINADQKRMDIMPIAYPGDDRAHVWQVTVRQNGNAADLSGHGVMGYFFREYDGENCSATGEAIGNVASVAIPAWVYEYPCRVTGILRLTTTSGAVVTLGVISFHVGENLTANPPLDPTSILPNYSQLFTLVERMEENVEEYDAIKDTIAADSRNLFSLTTSPQTIHGLTITQNADGTVTINGTNTAVTIIYLCGTTGSTSYKLAAGTYIFNRELVSGAVSSGGTPTFRYFDQNHTSASGEVISLATAKEFEYNFGLALRIASGAVCSNAVYRFTVEESETLHAWVPPVTTAKDNEARADVIAAVEKAETETQAVKDVVDATTGMTRNLFRLTNETARTANGQEISVIGDVHSIIKLNTDTTATIGLVRFDLCGSTGTTDYVLPAGKYVFRRELTGGSAKGKPVFRRFYANMSQEARDAGGEAVMLDTVYNFSEAFTVRLHIAETAQFEDAVYRFIIEKTDELHGWTRSVTPTAIDWEARDDIAGLREKLPGGSIRILGVGNSNTRDAMRWLWRILKESGKYDNVVVGHGFWNGATLKEQYDERETHIVSYRKYVTTEHPTASNSTIAQICADESWDVCIFSDKIDNAEDYSAWVSDAFDINDLLDYVRTTAENPSMKFGLHMNHSRSSDYAEGYDQEARAAAIAANIRRVASHMTRCDYIVNQAIAVQLARRNTYLNALGNELTRDKSHLAYGVPRYLASMAYAVTICGVNPFEIDWFPTSADEGHGAGDEDYPVYGSEYTAFLAKQCVLQACLDV